MSCALLSRPSLSREAALAASRYADCGPAANLHPKPYLSSLDRCERGKGLPCMMFKSRWARGLSGIAVAAKGRESHPLFSCPLFPELAGPSGAIPGIGPATLFQGRGALTDFLNQQDGKE